MNAELRRSGGEVVATVNLPDVLYICGCGCPIRFSVSGDGSTTVSYEMVGKWWDHEDAPYRHILTVLIFPCLYDEDGKKGGSNIFVRVMTDGDDVLKKTYKAGNDAHLIMKDLLDALNMAKRVAGKWRYKKPRKIQ